MKALVYDRSADTGLVLICRQVFTKVNADRDFDCAYVVISPLRLHPPVGFQLLRKDCRNTIAGDEPRASPGPQLSPPSFLGPLLRGLLLWRGGLVHAEILFLRPFVMRPVRVDPRLRPILRPPYPVVPDPVMRSARKTPVPDRGIERDRFPVER